MFADSDVKKKIKVDKYILRFNPFRGMAKPLILSLCLIQVFEF
jgi:hypothetical protein